MNGVFLRALGRKANLIVLAVCALLLACPTGQMRPRVISQEETTSSLYEELAHSPSDLPCQRTGKRKSKSMCRRGTPVAQLPQLARRVFLSGPHARYRSEWLCKDRSSLNGCGAPLRC
jgi:hypothetical protein